MIAEFISNYVIAFISAVGYPGIFILMFLESTLIPIPSEAVMPFTGFLVAQGKMSLIALILVSGIASLAGSLFSYYIGYFGGEKFIRKYGKYFLLNQEHLDKSNEWFKKHGGKTIFFSRFVVGVRHVISVPAGASKMNLAKFSLFTFAGAAIWNIYLIFIGIILQENWKIILKYTQILDLIVLVLAIVLIVWFIAKRKTHNFVVKK